MQQPYSPVSSVSSERTRRRRRKKKWGAKAQGKYELSACYANRPSGVPEVERMVEMKLLRTCGDSVANGFTALRKVAQKTSDQRRQRKREMEGLAVPTDKASPILPRWKEPNTTEAKGSH